jgi:hypothetical protein
MIAQNFIALFARRRAPKVIIVQIAQATDTATGRKAIPGTCSSRQELSRTEARHQSTRGSC